MSSHEQTETPTVANPFAAADVLEILRQHRWLTTEPSVEHLAWCERAAFLLGPQVSDRAALEDLLGLVFHYDAKELFTMVESHVVFSRYAARDVLRQVALVLLDGEPLTSDRYKEIIIGLKQNLDLRIRELFHPVRLALAGRAGEGELDRVILLLDPAAALPFAVPVKSAYMRIVEFCATFE